MKSLRDTLIDMGVFCPIHGVDYDVDCEKCQEVTRDYVLKRGLYTVFMKILAGISDPKYESWNSGSFLFYLRNEKAIHEDELKKARAHGDRELELRESGYLQALDFVIDALLNE